MAKLPTSQNQRALNESENTLWWVHQSQKGLRNILFSLSSWKGGKDQSLLITQITDGEI